ncbi:thioredoxin TrxC [Zavarzinia aquatilis]|uniref:Thioredoxin TrxC n=1 Tax=Zavarzinia aquatilis TaxID=2211142 RepID=A0A317DVU0_9PROT|nr:thioredoxin TrxC [Zavarzinia aquatilis]PWR18484.1 thioredoxin TrxC [Zavarzinia aquatilis]
MPAPASDLLTVCPHCAAVNRLPRDRPATEGRCGQCHKALFDGHPAEVDAAGFERQVGRSSQPVLVDVWAPWCGPCRMMGPAFAAAAGRLEPGFRLLKLNSDAEPELSGRLGIRSIPTLLLFAGGRRIAQVSGAMTTEQIVAWARQQLAQAA